MAISPISPVSLNCFVYAFLLLLCPLGTLKKCHAIDANETTKTDFHVVKVNSLLPSNVCDQTNEALKGGTSLKLVQKYGPCIQVDGVNKASKVPSAANIIVQDRIRANWIRAKLSMSSTSGVFNEMRSTVLPAYDDMGGYVVTVGLGTPKKNTTLLFDTGSELVWTQCQPCAGGCFPQNEPIFDPKKSTSYKNLSCTSNPCKIITQDGEGGCSSSTCAYQFSYGSGSSNGFLATETLTVSSSDIFKNFVMGCGQKNEGTFSGLASGLLGLGRSPISFVFQTAKKYKSIFSYCIPSSASTIGFLRFGNKAASQNVKLTPLSTIQETFYGVDMVGISVGGRKLPIDASVFTKTGTIIDSGSTVTSLPSTASSALSSAFQKAMTGYPLVKNSTELKPCYDLRKYANANIKLPAISLLFKGGVQLDVDQSGILYPVNGLKEMCLGFQSTDEDTDQAIFGNLQQKTYEVVYDVPKGLLGFAPRGCK